MQLAYPAGMTNGSPRQTRRRENLRQLVDANGGQAQVALEIETPKSHLSAVLAGRRGIGDALAQKIEQHFDLPPGWMDAPHGTPDAEFSSLLAEAETLPTKQRDWVLMTLREAVKLAKETVSEATEKGRDFSVERSDSPKKRRA